MKLECNLEKIKNAVSSTERITGKNLSLPILDSVLISASKKSLKFRSTNLNLGIEIEISAKVEREGSLVVKGSSLVGIFSNIFQNENILLEEKDGNVLIKTKNNQIKLKGQKGDDFPTIPVIEEGVSFEINPEKIIEGIKSVYYSASFSGIKPEISSVYIYSEDNTLIFVSTDSFRLAEKRIKVKNIPEISGILIPFKNISEILRVLGECKEDLKIAFNKNQISFSSDGLYLTSRLIDGVFPDYRQIIPKEHKTEVVVLKQELINALKLSNVFSDKFNQINLEVSPKEKSFKISSSNNDIGENITKLDGALKGETVSVGFNYKYFLDCFQSINSDSISIKLNQSSKPMIITGVSDTSFLYLIMPMNR
ncbi:MAG: DNA polymerase III subunit beta [Candidatus Paceibacterota bacterium]